MLFLELANLGLKALHGSGGMKLLYGKGVHQPADNNGQGDNGKPEATKQDVGQPNDNIYHWSEDD